MPPTTPLGFDHLVLIPGERMIWDIQAKGFSIARAEMTVKQGEVTSHVETNALASAVSTLSHDLATTLDGEVPLPKTSSETLAVDSEITKSDAAYSPQAVAIDGKSIAIANVHDLHTAIGAIRAWAIGPDVHAGFLNVLVGKQVYRVEVNQPLVSEVAGAKALRVDCRVLPPNGKGAIAASFWLAITEDRAPLRIEMQSDKGRLAAELVERTEAH